MNELALFAGAGGGILGSKLLSHRIIGYVENNEYCQKILAQRIKDGIFDEAPIFGDIRAFNREGYAESYKGLVDVVSGGFPCQDISCAGKGEGITGERSGLWFEMEQTIRLVQPRYVFIENSPILLVRGFEHVICGLSQMGFDAAWGIVSAADVGAPHLRKRIWILAQSNLADTKEQSKRPRLRKGEQASIWGRRFSNSGCEIPNAGCELPQIWGTRNWNWRGGTIEQSQSSSWTTWATEPELGRVANGVAHRVDRLKAIGNGQVPFVAATAFMMLHSKLGG